MASKLSLFLVAVLAAVLVDLAASKCNPRDFNKGSVVCVCSDTLKCEGDFAHLKINPDKSTVTAYRTTKAGERFEHAEYKFTAAASKPAGAASVVSVTINPEKKHQKIYGFGGAFTDSTGLNILKLPKTLQTRLMRDYFAPEGIGYNYGRIPIGGCDFSTRPYSYDDNADDETLDKFALAAEDFAYKIPFLKQARELSNNSITFFGSPWASPAWMKTNKQLNHGGVLIGEPGGKYYKLYAKYLAKFFQEYQKQDVNVWGLTVVNEPHFGYEKNYKFNVLGFTAETQRDFVKLDLGPVFESLGLKDKKIMIFDDNVPHLTEFATKVLDDKEANKYVAGVAFHWYDNKLNPRGEILDGLKSKYSDKFFLSTEACETWGAGDGKNFVLLGNWNTFEAYADDIIQDLNHNTNGWIDWNMVLDTQGGPNWVDNFVDAPIIVNASSGEYYKQPSFYALGHFAKFLLPESVRLEHEEKGVENKEVLITVFERPDKSKVVTVLNKKSDPVTLQVHDPARGYVTVDVKAQSLESLIIN